jgi:hypothetical protein
VSELLIAAGSSLLIASGSSLLISADSTPDPDPKTLEFRDEGHTATFRERHQTITVQENRP